MSPSVADRVTMRPVAVEMQQGGDLRDQAVADGQQRVGLRRPRPGAMPCCMTPIAKPPMRLISVMMMPAIASPLTNFEAPSIAP